MRVGGEGHGCHKMKCHKEKYRDKKNPTSLFHKSKQCSIEANKILKA